jgi:hypothetical protein
VCDDDGWVVGFPVRAERAGIFLLEDFIMGYTHDWRFVRPVTEEEIDTVMPLIKDIAKRYRDVIKSTRRRSKGEIFYDEKGDNPYETFYVNLTAVSKIIERKGHEALPYLPENRWCKTARHPYDIAVCEMLLVLAAKVRGFKFSSDGFDRRCVRQLCDDQGLDESWPQAIENVNKLYNLNYEAGYFDLGNAFVFDVTVDGESVLDSSGNETVRSISRQGAKSKRKVREFCAV